MTTVACQIEANGMINRNASSIFIEHLFITLHSSESVMLAKGNIGRLFGCKIIE